MRRSPIAVALLALAFAAPAVSARADVFESTELVSQGFLPGTGAIQQAGFAHDAALSGNGVYVAFDGTFAGLRGVWRRDLQSGEVRPVAVGRPLGLETCATTVTGASSSCDAELPSISENGQYVTFTTTAPLAAHDDTNTSPDVYVRNMDIEAQEPEAAACETAEAEDAPDLQDTCAFTLVSAADGSDTGLAYSGETQLGAVAAGRSAISADGMRVAFVTTAVSDLTDPGEPTNPVTPGMQVAMRDLATRQTMLVSARYDAASGQAIPNEPVGTVQGNVAFGAVFAVASQPHFPSAFLPGPYAMPAAVGASISADGSTVAWTGVDVGEQAKTLADESLAPFDTEPLWRRISEGPTTPTRRVTGGADPENPACIASGETALGPEPSSSDPCQGPFTTETGIEAATPIATDFVPQLSADGYQVAFLANAKLVALGTDFGLARELPSDLYLVDMHPGLTRDQALTPLTELASGETKDPATDAPIVDLSMSASGGEVAFTTRRTEFPLGVPAFVSPAAALPGMLELFDVDLADKTLTRVSEGFEGGPSFHPHAEQHSNEDPYPHEQDGALSPSFSGDGNTLAFNSTAANLVFGDGNTPAVEAAQSLFDGGDAFVVHRHVFASTPTPQSVSPPPPSPALGPGWSLGVSAASLKNGAVRLYVTVPGLGTLRASAQGAVVVKVAAKPAARHKPERAAHGAAVKKAKTAVVTRTLANTSKAAKKGEGELLTLTLTLASRYRSLALARGGQFSTVTVSFSSPGHPTLRQTLPVTFVNTTHPKAKKPAKGHRASRRRHG